MSTPHTAPGKQKWYEHNLWQGAGGALVAALIAAVIAIVGIVIGNSGVASGVLPGSPEVTVTAAGPTVTVTPPAVTVTVTATPSSEPSVTSEESADPAVLHLTETEGLPEGILAPNPHVNWETNLDIDGKRFSTGWTSPMGSSTSPRIAIGINTNGQYARFRARIGLSANESNDHATRVAILGDGKVLKEQTVTLSNSEDVDLSIKDVIRVQIKVYPPDGDRSSVDVAIGDPTIEKDA